MDHQLPQNNNGFDTLFGDGQQYHAYNNDFLNGSDQSFSNSNWDLNAGPGFNQSRGQPALPTTWQSNADHLSTAAGNTNPQIAQYAYARGMSNSPAPFHQSPYGGFPPQQRPPQQFPQAQYDPALFHTSTPHPGFSGNYAPYANPPPQTLSTIAPQALQQQQQQQQQQQARPSSTPTNNYAGLNYAQNAFPRPVVARPPSSVNVNQQALVASIPKGQDAGLYSNVSYDDMARATNSERMGAFVNIGRQPLEWPANRTTTLPAFVPRKPKNELRKLAGNDASLLARIGKKSVKKQGTIGGLAGMKGPGSPQIKYEGETSSSEESSDDDDSSYTSDEEQEGSPLPTRRPEGIREAVEYDTIKALWRPKRKPVGGEQIKKGMGEFWEVVKTIRDRWKTDSSALQQAEEKKKIGELPLLKSRVKDQRDMMETALKTALKHGHRSIVELMGENASLIFVCYQFLLDRFKAEDLNGQLSRAILELLALFTTLSNATLEKTHLVKVLPRYVKMGDAKTAGYAKRITANAANATKEKEKAANAPPSKPGTDGKTTSASPPPQKKAEPEPVAGIKRSASTAGDGGAQKKVALGAPKPNGASTASKPNGTTILKKTTTTGDGAKPATTSTVPATKTKQVTAKPSNFFSTLQSAKKPGTSIKTGAPAQATGTKPTEKRTTSSTASTAKPASTFSFAETMANLSKPKEEKPAPKPEKEAPPETPEQKAKRLRKEARRQLHVRFADSEDLVQVRYFTHDPDEELGHEDSQMRDVSDAGGEGRALKQHQDQMDVDEEDDEGEKGEGKEQSLIDFKEPSPIDFSDIDAEDRQRNYIKFGGELKPESPERAAREQYEANTLIVFYTDEKDIPPDPSEPADPYSGQETTIDRKDFGMPEAKYLERARQKKASGTTQPYASPQQAQSGYGLAQYFASRQQQPPQSQTPPAHAQAPPPPQQATPQFDLQSLLSNLQNVLPQQQSQPQQAPSLNQFGAAAAAAPAQQPQQQQFPQPQPQSTDSGQHIDLSAILAAMNNQNVTSQQPGAPSSTVPMFPPAAGGFQNQQQQQSAGGGSGAGNGSEPPQQQKRWRDQGDKNKFFKTKVCKYWQEGRCMKGDGCTYLHEETA